jgi:site-specific DNA-methyltransferase (adenine-specific)
MADLLASAHYRERNAGDEMIDLRLGDCLEVMPQLPDKSVDAIITDLPYGTTACSWDTVIPFEPLWAQVKRLLKPRGVFVTTASQPFTSALVMSNPEWFSDEWIWRKDRPSNVYHARRHPLKYHESIVAFAQNGHTYNPQMGVRHPNNKRNNKARVNHSNHFGDVYLEISHGASDEIYPCSIFEYSRPQDKLHPTQKPLALYEYLILTYTNPGDVVLDPCMGSGTTLEACVKTGRDGVGIELREDYYDIARRRIEAAQQQLTLELV